MSPCFEIDIMLKIPKTTCRILVHWSSRVFIFPQYVMSGEWKGNEVAIRVANDNAFTGEGLEFIEEAITTMKYVLLISWWVNLICNTLQCRKFAHQNLLKLHGLCTREGALFVVTEPIQLQGTWSYWHSRVEAWPTRPTPVSSCTEADIFWLTIVTAIAMTGLHELVLFTSLCRDLPRLSETTSRVGGKWESSPWYGHPDLFCHAVPRS